MAGSHRARGPLMERWSAEACPCSAASTLHNPRPGTIRLRGLVIYGPECCRSVTEYD